MLSSHPGLKKVTGFSGWGLLKNKKNMVLHYSINFENGFITHHGETEYPLSVYQNSEPYIDSMIAFVKADLTKSIKKWGFTPDDMIKADFYFFKGSEEIIFFQWEKETVNNEEP